MEHKKGPWKDDGSHIRSADGQKVLCCKLAWTNERGKREEQEANAHLIAAAPDLLNLAKMFEYYVMDFKVGKDGKAFTSLELECFIRDMISKAQGN